MIILLQVGVCVVSCERQKKKPTEEEGKKKSPTASCVRHKID